MPSATNCTDISLFTLSIFNLNVLSPAAHPTRLPPASLPPFSRVRHEAEASAFKFKLLRLHSAMSVPFVGTLQQQGRVASLSYCLFHAGSSLKS